MSIRAGAGKTHDGVMESQTFATVSTPASSTLVATARLGPNMPRHRLLLDVGTACGIVIGPSWLREPAPYAEVACTVCLAAGREFRRGATA